MSQPPYFEFVVEKSLSGIRIDSFLGKHLRNYNTWRLQRIVAAGAVTINFATAAQTDRVFRGQTVSIRLLEPPDKLLEPEAIPLEIVYEDNWIMVINKPADLVVHPVGEIQLETLANGLQHLLDQRTELKGILRPGIVHRLDRQTSGAIVVAITHRSHAALAAEFEASRVSKSYLALVEGNVQLDRGVIDRPIGRALQGRHVLMSCRPDAAKPRKSKTVYRVVERYEDYTLVLARPLTGRNHQIRVHLAHLGHSLVGDEFYLPNGKFKPFDTGRVPGDSREIETGLPIKRHALHAIQLEVTHPVSGLWMNFQAELPADFRETIEVLRNSRT
ncbi:RluA family pseudouridine synthase [Planctomicrobium sp.]|nr:RluA family pseudouridine synthase [Planctomicrobium sp.]MDB4732942.1 RluA family pseudouridine synthase [Planctomicrobium sp.]